MRNEMMHRPVVKPELVDYLRTEQKQLPGELGQIQKEANEKGVPIIPHETVVFMQFLLGQLQPKKILEIGTRIKQIRLGKTQIFFFSSRRRHTRYQCDWSSDVCSFRSIISGRPTRRRHVRSPRQRLPRT